MNSPTADTDIIRHDIVFSLIFEVIMGNPNGDPLNENTPRTDRRGYGMVTDVCIKRKIRNRLQEILGPDSILVQSDDRATDGYTSILGRLKGNGITSAEEACAKWIDVRAFGQVITDSTKNDKTAKADDSGAQKPSSSNMHITGPVTVQIAKSLSPVEIMSLQITKSVNGQDKKKKNSDETEEGMSSDRMGRKDVVAYGVYRVNGAIKHTAAEKTGLTNADAENIRKALLTLFDGDESSARPAGSMNVIALYWWENGNSDASDTNFTVRQILDQLEITCENKDDYACCIDDYKFQTSSLANVDSAKSWCEA